MEELKVKLNPNNPNEELIFNFLLENMDAALKEKILNGNKALADCWQYIIEKARKNLNGKSGAVKSDVVFGWALHYFQEDSVSKYEVKTTHHKLKVNNDIDEYDEIEETPKPIKQEKPKKAVKKEENHNIAYEQTNLFDFL